MHNLQDNGFNFQVMPITLTCNYTLVASDVAKNHSRQAVKSCQLSMYGLQVCAGVCVRAGGRAGGRACVHACVCRVTTWLWRPKELCVQTPGSFQDCIGRSCVPSTGSYSNMRSLL